LEGKALDLPDVTKARIRGITAVSAVALWFKASECTLAEQLAHSMLTDSQIPAFAREELRNLVRPRALRGKVRSSERTEALQELAETARWVDRAAFREEKNSSFSVERRLARFGDARHTAASFFS
jgi:hypothetical protein